MCFLCLWRNLYKTKTGWRHAYCVITCCYVAIYFEHPFIWINVSLVLWVGFPGKQTLETRDLSSGSLSGVLLRPKSKQALVGEGSETGLDWRGREAVLQSSEWLELGFRIPFIPVPIGRKKAGAFVWCQLSIPGEDLGGGCHWAGQLPYCEYHSQSQPASGQIKAGAGW